VNLIMGMYGNVTMKFPVQLMYANLNDFKRLSHQRSWAWWCMSIIPALRRLRQKDCKFKTTWTI
jgi:hypothetical protein